MGPNKRKKSTGNLACMPSCSKHLKQCSAQFQVFSQDSIDYHFFTLYFKIMGDSLPCHTSSTNNPLIFFSTHEHPLVCISKTMPEEHKVLFYGILTRTTDLFRGKFKYVSQIKLPKVLPGGENHGSILLFAVLVLAFL